MNIKTTISIVALLAILAIMITPVYAVVHEDNQSQSQNIKEQQNKTVFLDTNGKTGHLKYLEEYYSVDNTNNLTLDQTRIYFDGDTNNSKMSFVLIRPLDKNGNPYPDSYVKGIAVLNNETILNSWYAQQRIQTVSAAQDTPKLEYPEVFFGLVIVVLIIVAVVIRSLIKRKKGNIKIEGE